jgi:putative tricarboxylic transport membrane protein
MPGNGSTMTRVQRDLLMGVLLLVFAISFYALSYLFSGYEIEGLPKDVGPTFLPRLVLAVLALESIFLIFFSLRGNGKIPPDSEKQKPLWHSRPIIMFGAFLVYVYLATLFGYIASTIAFLILSFYLLGVHNVWQLVVVPPAITLATYYLFETLLDVYLPSGSLF